MSWLLTHKGMAALLEIHFKNAGRKKKVAFPHKWIQAVLHYIDVNNKIVQMHHQSVMQRNFWMNRYKEVVRQAAILGVFYDPINDHTITISQSAKQTKCDDIKNIKLMQHKRFQI